MNTVIAGFAASVDDVDLAQPVAARVGEQLREWWADYPILIFSDQDFSHTGLAAAARIFGDFGDDPYLLASSEHRHVVEIRRDPAETTPIFGANWHSDWSFQARPPSATILHAKIIPPFGGDTLFADGYRAYETLNDDLKNDVKDLYAVHSATRAYGPKGLFARDDATRSMAIRVCESATEMQTHPIVRRHPQSGRHSLFINPVYTIGVEGKSRNAGQALLNRLFEHMTDERFVYRHRWTPNTLIVWDNRCVIHYAEGGYEGHARLMHRTTVAGEAPIPAQTAN